MTPAEHLDIINSICEESEMDAAEAEAMTKALSLPVSPIQGVKLPKYKPTRKLIRNRDVLSAVARAIPSSACSISAERLDALVKRFPPDPSWWQEDFDDPYEPTGFDAEAEHCNDPYPSRMEWRDYDATWHLALLFFAAGIAVFCFCFF